MSYATLDPSRTALVLFDIVNAYVKASPERTEALAPQLDRWVRLRAAARDLGMMVVYTRSAHRPDGTDHARRYSDLDTSLQPWADPEHDHFGQHTRPLDGTWRGEIIDELAPNDDEYVVHKKRWNAFHQTHLELVLRTRGVDTIVLCGGSVSIGCAATAFGARDLDLEVVMVRDACFTHDEPAVATFMDRVFPVFCRVRTTDDVLGMLPSLLR